MGSRFSAMERSLLIPIGVGIVSAMGLCLAVFVVYLDTAQTPPPTTETPTPFQYLLLATETPVFDLDLGTRAAENLFDSPIFPTTPEPGFPTSTAVQINTASGDNQPGSIATATIALLNVIERYDDTDPRLEYDGDWTVETNVQNAHQRTLSASNTSGSDALFNFTGRQIVIGYVGEPGSGSMLISIDDREFLLDQSIGEEWVSPQFTPGSHFVILLHQSGSSINLDYIDILDS